MADKVGEVYVEITAKDDDVQEKLKEAEREAENAGKSFQKMGDSAGEGSAKTEKSANRMREAVVRFSRDAIERFRNVSRQFRDMGQEMAGTAINFTRSITERFRHVSERFRHTGEEMVDMADNLTSAIALPFTLLAAALINALKSTKSGKSAYQELQKAVQKLNEALVPMAKTVLNIALQYFPPLLKVIKQATQWFLNLSPATQKMLVAISALVVAIGPVVAFVGALVLGLGALGTALGALLTPLGLLAAGFVGLAIHARIGSKGVIEAFVNMRNHVRAAIQGINKEIGAQFSGIWKKLSDAIKQGNPQQIGIALAEMVNKGVQVLPQMLGKINWNGLMQSIIKGINNVAVGLKSFVGAVNWGAIIDLIAKGIEQTYKFVGKLIPPIIHLFVEVFNQIPWDQVASHLSGSAARISDAFLKMLDAAVDKINYEQLIMIALKFIDKFVSALMDPTLWWQVIQKHWQLLIGIVFAPERLLGPILKVISKIPFGKIGATMLQELNNLGGPMRAKIGQKLGEWFGKAKDKILEKLGDLGSRLKTKISNALVQALGGHDGKWSNVVQQWKTVALNKLSDWGSKLKSKISSGIKSGISGFEGKFSSMAGKWKDKLLAPFKKLDFRSLVQKAIDAIKNIRIPRIPMPHFYRTGTIKIGPVELPKFGVKWYATGGVFTGPSVIGVGEAGPEAVVPLSGPRMRPFAQAIAKELGGTGGANITVYNYTNDKKVGHEIAKAINRELWKHAF